MATSLEIIGFLVWWGAVFWHSWHTAFDRTVYQTLRQRVSWTLAIGIILFLWFVLFVLVVVANYTFWRDFEASSVYTTTLILSIVQLGLGKIWHVVMFRARSGWWGPLLAFLAVAFAIAVDVLFIVAGAWLAFGLYTPYVLWLLYLMVLSFRFASAMWGIPREAVFSDNTSLPTKDPNVPKDNPPAFRVFPLRE